MALSPLQMQKVAEAVKGYDRYEVVSYGLENAPEISKRDQSLFGIYRALFLAEFCGDAPNKVMESRIKWAQAQGIPTDPQTATGKILAFGMAGMRPSFLDPWPTCRDVYFDLWAVRQLKPDGVKAVHLSEFDAWCTWLETQIQAHVACHAVQASFDAPAVSGTPIPPPSDDEVPF